MNDIYINCFKTSRGGVKLNWDGFIYEKNRVTTEKQYWICELRSSEKYKCNSRITTVYDEEKKMYKLLNNSNCEHNHDPDSLKEKSLQVIPERAMKTYVNEKYIYGNATINVRRYGRKSSYYINMEGTTKMEFGNNVSLNLIFFEFLHNEYKRSFVEMKFNKICDAINHDPYVGRAFKLINLPCPLPAASHRIMNISIPMQDFPNVWPFERCKVEAALAQNKNGDTIATADLYILFKQTKKNRR